MRSPFLCAFLLSLASSSLLACGAEMADRGDPTAASPANAPEPIRVPLELSGDATGPTAKSIPYSPGLHLYMAAVADQRSDGNIGVNNEHETPIPVVSSGTNPAVFVGRVVERAFADLGFPVTRDASTANRFLELHLVRFYTVEGHVYQGEVRASAEVRDRSGQVLYSALVTGTARQWGRSLNPDNYREVFTRASFDMVKTMIEAPAFQSAIQAKEQPAAGH